MKPYAQRAVFAEHEIVLWERARAFIESLPTFTVKAKLGWSSDTLRWCRAEMLAWRVIPDTVPPLTQKDLKELRCHEITRAVARFLRLEDKVVDGTYGAADHSWLSLNPHTILDCYACGRLPQVQLVDLHFALPDVRCYVAGPVRDDIDEELVAALINEATRDER